MKAMLIWFAAAVSVFATPLAGAADVLQSLNVMRRSYGLPPYLPDPRLAQGAETICHTMARQGRSGHIGWHTRFGARAEGTGNRSITDPLGRRFYACYSASRRFRYAGASAVVGRGGRTFYTLILR